MADRFWVGGTGNWNDTAHWSTTSGGASGAAVPTSSDNVIFDTASSTANAAYTATVNATANCLDFTMDGPDPADATKVTWAGSSALNIYGSMNLSGGTAGITRSYTGQIVFSATSGTKTIATNGVQLGSGGININGSGGTFQLSDNLSFLYGYITINAGSFDPNGKGVTYDINTNDSVIIPSNITFYNLTVSPTKTGTTLQINSNFTVSNTLTINGLNSALGRILVTSNVLGTARTITAATVSVTNADFQDITGAGVGSWDLSAITGNSGDCGGNSGITFTTPATTDCSAGTIWSTATWSSRVPLPQDTATFSGSSRTITQNMSRIGSVNFTGSSGLTWTTSTICDVYGSINLTDLGTFTGSTQRYRFLGRGSYTITNAGKTWAKELQINCPGGTYTLQDNWTSSSFIYFYNGTFTATSQNLTFSNFLTQTGTKTINMGSGTWEMTGTTLSFSATGLTLNAQTSTLKLTYNGASNISCALGGTTWNNFWNATQSTTIVTITGSNTFNDFKINAGRTQKFTAGTTQTVSTFTAVGTAGNLITLDSSTTATYALTKTGGGTISCDYLSVQHSVASPANTWYAGTNSTNNQAVATAGSGWIFTAPPPPPTAEMLMFF